MTFEQLAIFVAVAEREHLTNAAQAIGLTPSAVSASIKTLETAYGVQLFHRVGRRIELTAAGRNFLPEAQAILSRARGASLVLSELGALQRGVLDVWASQTIANYWLPPLLMRFHDRWPGIALNLTVSNTKGVVQAVLDGRAEVGFVEGSVDEGALHRRVLAQDQMVIVAAADHPLAHGHSVPPDELGALTWILREEGSGTRSEFETALSALGLDPATLRVAMVLPSNEAVLSAVQSGSAATAISRAAADTLIAAGRLSILNAPLPVRQFQSLVHKERHASGAVAALLDLARSVHTSSST